MDARIIEDRADIGPYAPNSTRSSHPWRFDFAAAPGRIRFDFLHYAFRAVALWWIGSGSPTFPKEQMILIVDDQKAAGTALERLLRHSGHEAMSVAGGAEALAMLYVRKPSLLVLDVNMPEMDGLTVLRTIKENDGLKDMRVAMYSADTRQATMAEAKRLGAVDFLVKGTIGFDKLVARICELAGEPREQRAGS